MNPATFLQNCDRIITGYGFKRSIPINFGNCRRHSSGAPLDATVSEAGLDMLDTSSEGLIIFIDEGETDMLIFDFIVPQDYDESSDKLRIRALMSTDAVGTDEVYLDARIYRKRAGAALSADLDPTAETTVVPATVATAAWSEVNADDLDMQGGDCLTIELLTGAHAADGLLIYGIEVVYSACLVYFDEADRPIVD